MGTKKHQSSNVDGNVKWFDFVSYAKINTTWKKWQITAVILVATQVAGQL